MKKYILLVVLLLGYHISQAQQLVFCKEVDKEGFANGQDSSFILKSGEQIVFYLSDRKDLNTTKLNYEIYSVNDRGTERYDNTIEQKIEPDWRWAWKGIIFYRAGTYEIKVLNADNEKIASGRVKISFL